MSDQSVRCRATVGTLIKLLLTRVSAFAAEAALALLSVRRACKLVLLVPLVVHRCARSCGTRAVRGA